MALEDNLRALILVVVGSVLGVVFLISCVLSVIKAVRDRRQIKARITAKKAASQSNGRNGHAPGASSPEDGKRNRPNILIIHDDEREERIKKGTGLSARSGSTTRSPSGISSLEDHHSYRTESTTVAEVSYHHSLNSTPIEDGDGVHFSDGLAPGQSRGGKKTSLDINGEAVTYRRESSSCEHTGAKDYDHQTKHHARTAGYKNNDFDRKSNPKSQFKYVVDDDITYESRETGHSLNTPWSTSHGFAKNKKLVSHYVAQGTEDTVMCTKYNPRRNSYAAALSVEPDWVDLPPVRRHSDQPASLRRHDKDELHTRHHGRAGADNPAFDFADDKTSR